MHIPNLALAAKPGHRQALGRAGRVLVNLAGAASAALFARASLQFYLQTHRLIGVAFFAEQAWFVIAFLIRRPARSVATTGGPWLLAAGGTLYFAYPQLYASAFSGFYLPLMMVLWLLMLRGIGIELRRRRRWQGDFGQRQAFGLKIAQAQRLAATACLDVGRCPSFCWSDSHSKNLRSHL